MVAMTVKVIPALGDNYMYLLIDDETREAAAIDPVEPEKVVAAAKEENCEIICVLTTHYHWDHAKGNSKMEELIEGITIIAGDKRVERVNLLVSDGDKFSLGRLEVQCLSTPGHARGHMCYAVGPHDQEPDAVFTGDTLMVGGCGKLMDGNEVEMYETLLVTLGSLPPTCLVYCGHENTIKNLKFALLVEPNNVFVLYRLLWAIEKRRKDLPTVPTKIAYEKLYNPYMRVDNRKLQYAFGNRDGAKTLRDIMYKRETTDPSKYM